MTMPAGLSFRLPRSRGEIIHVLTVTGLLCGMVISLPLWLTGRAFPHLPCAALFAPWPAPFDAILTGAVALLLLAAVLSQGWRTTAAALGGCVLLALQDQMRWQPWFYQYLLMLAAAAVCRDRRSEAFPVLCRILFVCLYIWSGLHKLTPAYARMYEATFTAPLAEQWPAWAVEMLRLGGPVSPWLEIVLGAALCFRLTRNAGVIAAMGTHVAVLLLAGPAGTFTNTVIWPWNVVMLAMVPLLFWRVADFGLRELRTGRHRAAAAVLLLLAGVMPAFSMKERWDRYLSFHLYSGTERRMMIAVDDGAAAALPEDWRQQLQPSQHQPEVKELHYLAWSLAELRVPPPGDERLLLALARKCAAMDFAKRGEVMFYTDFAFQPEKGYDVFTGDEIRRMATIPALKRKF